MAIGSGLGGSLQAKIESAYGTASGTATAYEIEKESLNRQQKSMVATGLAAGRYVDLGSRRIVTTEDAGGSIDTPVMNSGFGRLISMFMGGGGTPTVDGATASFTQTHTIGALAGKSLSLQKLAPDTGGNSNLYTYRGAKCTGASFDCGVDSVLSMSTDWDVQQQDTTVATFGAASYPAAMVPFHFAQNSARIGAAGTVLAPVTGGTAMDGLKKFSLKIDRKMAVDRYYFNNALATDGTSGVTKSEPILNDQVGLSGSLDFDFTPTAKTQIYDLYKSNSPFSFTVAFTGAIIASTYNYQIAFQFTQCYVDGSSPELSGPGLLGNSIPFVALGDGTNSALTIIYRSTDTTL